MKPAHDDSAVMRLATAKVEDDLERLSERELNKRMRSLVSIRIQLSETRRTRMSLRTRAMLLVVLVTLVAALLSPYRTYILASGVALVCLCGLLPGGREAQFFSWLARYPVFNQPRFNTLRETALTPGADPWSAIDDWIAAEINDVAAMICHLKMTQGFSKACRRESDRD